MSNLHHIQSLRGTGAPDIAPHYIALPNSGSVKLMSLNRFISDWAQQHIKESFDIYAQCIGTIAVGNFAGTLDFCSGLFGSTTESPYLSGFEQFTHSGWDGDDAVAVAKKDLKFARSLLEKVALYLPSVPDAAAGTDGSICMEWIANSPVGPKKLFVDVSPDDSVLTFAQIGNFIPWKNISKKAIRC